jgi:large subunit ribosomal protein L6
VTLKGPKGELSCGIDPSITVTFVDNQIQLKRSNDKKEVKAKHGLYQALLANNCKGVFEGFTKSLQLVGIGYRVQMKGKGLEFTLGYSHPVLFEAVDGILFTVEGQDKLIVTGIDKQLVGEVCARIKKLRKRDAYKGKGIHFVGDQIRKKPGKKIKK